MPGSTPATSQLDWLSSTTAMIVLSWSKATRDLLKSFSWGIRALHQSVTCSDDGATSFAACPIPSLCWRETDSNHRFRLRYSPSGSSLVVSAELSTLPSRKRSSQRTQRWREVDSNHRFPVGRSNRDGRRAWLSRKGSGSLGEPKVRIHLPPAVKSRELSQGRIRRPRSGWQPDRFAQRQLDCGAEPG